jgi:hypothetical protein
MAYNKAFNPDALPAYEHSSSSQASFTDEDLYLAMLSLKKLPKRSADFKIAEDLPKHLR